MSEKEKGKLGQLYNPNYDQELTTERLKAKELCFDYNNTRPSYHRRRRKILKLLLGKTGKEFLIEQPFYCDYGYNIEIGENFYSNHNMIILDGAKVKFGDNVFVGPNCSFYTTNHALDIKRRNEGLEQVKPIIVENNVWLGENVIILQGITIGNNVVIGAGSIVTKDIPDNCLAVGNPARIIKENINKE